MIRDLVSVATSIVWELIAWLVIVNVVLLVLLLGSAFLVDRFRSSGWLKRKHL